VGHRCGDREGEAKALILDNSLKEVLRVGGGSPVTVTQGTSSPQSELLWNNCHHLMRESPVKAWLQGGLNNEVDNPPGTLPKPSLGSNRQRNKTNRIQRARDRKVEGGRREIYLC
jgi:hypothetical protein